MRQTTQVFFKENGQTGSRPDAACATDFTPDRKETGSRLAAICVTDLIPDRKNIYKIALTFCFDFEKLLRTFYYSLAPKNV